MSVIHENTPRSRTGTSLYRGTVAEDVESLASRMFVIVPEFSDSLKVGPCPWSASGELAGLPQEGDDVLVAFDNLDQPWVVSWWPTGPIESPGAEGQFLRTHGGAAIWQEANAEDLKGPVTVVPDGVGSGYFASIQANAAHALFRGKVSGDTEWRHDVLTNGMHLWGDGTTQDTNLYRDGTNKLRTDDTFQAAALIGAIEGTQFQWHVGTSPPGSPADGMLWIYQGSDFYWLFVYDSSEATNKWKCIGGPPLEVYSSTDLGTAGTTTFSSPTLTVPRAGDYLLSYSALIDGGPNVNTQTTWAIMVWKNGTTEIGERSVTAFVADVTAFVVQNTASATDLPLSFAANDTIQLRGTATNWDFNCRYRSISIKPKRVI